MGISDFLAKVFGLYLLVVSIALLRQPKKVKSIGKIFMKDEGLMYIGGALALIIGILTITTHNVWVADWPLIITIFAWLSFLKGCMLIAFPEYAKKMAKKMEKQNLQYFGIAYLIIGLFLCWQGFI